MRYILFIWKVLITSVIDLRVNFLFQSGKHLHLNCWNEYFAHKKVVIIGPAEGYNVEVEKALNECDIIVLVNKGYRTPLYEKYQAVGKKIVLFHCLDESEVGGCGALNKREMLEKGITDIFYQLNENKLAHNVLAFLKKNDADFNLYWMRKDIYKKLKNGIFGYVPNTGFAALFGIHQSACEWLYVHGLTFHRTAYLPEYGNDGEDLRRNIEFIERAGNHNPDMDWKLFLRLHEQGRILTSPLLTQLMDLPYKPLFYVKQKQQPTA
jgi:hypothetical protein